jgi:AraC-like DNA-binding protein
MQATARGRIVCWPGGSLWIGEASGSAGFHDHHAIQISLAFRGSIRFRTRERDWHAYQAALVPPHLSHAFEGASQSTAQIFIEPETAEGRALLGRFGADSISELPTNDVDHHAQALHTIDVGSASADELRRVTDRFIAALAATQRPRRVDARIERVIQTLRRNDRPMTLADAAGKAALSPGRFRHLFVEQTGQSFRSYQLWGRLQRAIDVISRGLTATEAAHAAGFADAAHLTRTFRRMMGIAPTSVKIDRRPPSP